MTTSGQGPRIRRVSLAPTAAAAPDRPTGVGCPHCGGTAVIGTPAGELAQADAASAAAVVGLPEVGAVRVPVARLLRLVLEVIDGRRPAAQLDGVVAPSVLRYLRAACVAGPVRVSRLGSLRVCRPTEQAAEAAAVVEVDQRVRAVAARFEHQQAGWRCVAFRIL
jgi:hypothetical protein